MTQLNISTGLKEYSLVGSDGGKVSIYMNPTDTKFIDKILNVFDEFEAEEEELKERFSSKDVDKIIEVGNEVDTEMRKKFIEVFGKDIITPLIGNVSVYALAEGPDGVSFPIWVNILVAIVDAMKHELSEEQKRSAEKIKKYTKKYQK